jgi:PTH2 family peptidyl-tRNA hydrolase
MAAAAPSVDALACLAAGAAGFAAGYFAARWTPPEASAPRAAPAAGGESKRAAREDQAAAAASGAPAAPAAPAAVDDDDSDEDVDLDEEEIERHEPMKMVLCVRMDLKMGAGKMCAQCAHAAVGAVGRLRRRKSKLFQIYTAMGQKKIAVRIPDEETLLAIERKARKLGLISYVVQDAGRTQVKADSLTVVAVGPGRLGGVSELRWPRAYTAGSLPPPLAGPESVVDQVTKEFKLL